MTNLAGVMPFTELPAGWQLSRISDMAILINGYPFASELFSPDGDIPLVRIRDVTALTFETFISRDQVPSSAWIEHNDLLIGMDGDFNTALWTRGPAALNQRVCLLRPRADNDIRFIAYVLPGLLKIVNDLTYATTVKHLSSGGVNALRVARPDISTQRRIADFLDVQTAKIDALIRKQERLIETLAERQQAVISHAVTKGLNPNAPVKGSPVLWIGEVPDHWEIGNIRRFAQMKTGHTPSRTHPEYWVDCTIPWCTLADVWQLRAGQRYLGETNALISELGLANSAADLLPAGTVVLSRTASVGFTGIMPIPMATSQDYWNWICKPGLEPTFLWYQFRAMRSHFLSLMQGSTHKTIYQAQAAALTVAAPPLAEQQTIVKYLDRETAQMDALSVKAREMIGVLKERRRALISAAVTGKIDVRGLC